MLVYLPACEESSRLRTSTAARDPGTHVNQVHPPPFVRPPTYTLNETNHWSKCGQDEDGRPVRILRELAAWYGTFPTASPSCYTANEVQIAEWEGEGA